MTDKPMTEEVSRVQLSDDTTLCSQMTILDLKEKIKDFPDNLFVYLNGYCLMDANIFKDVYENGDEDTFVNLTSQIG